METLEQIKSRIEAAVSGARLEIIPNGSAANQPSLLVSNEHASAVAQFLRDDPQLQFDYASNVTGIDWLDKITKEKVKVKKVVDGAEQEFEETVETTVTPAPAAMRSDVAVGTRMLVIVSACGPAMTRSVSMLSYVVRMLPLNRST